MPSSSHRIVIVLYWWAIPFKWLNDLIVDYVLDHGVKSVNGKPYKINKKEK